MTPTYELGGGVGGKGNDKIQPITHPVILKKNEIP